MSTAHTSLNFRRVGVRTLHTSLPWPATGALALAVLVTTGCGTASSPGAAPATTPPAAASTTLTPAEQRISDRAIQADHAAYAALQARIKGVNDKGRPVRDYALSKAQCWLDVSFHEYTRNDRGGFPQAALHESEKLIQGMEAAPPMAVIAGAEDTPLVNGAQKLRTDLWLRTAELKRHSGFACAQQLVACAEVELVHAGNEINQQQWRHAKPYVQIAEDQLGEAQRLADACPRPAVPMVAPPPAPVPPAPVVVAPLPERLTLAAQVLFAFDRHGIQDVHRASMDELALLVQRIQGKGFNLDRIQLIGHADRLNDTGRRHYNEQLSERRARSVREWLVSHGIDAAKLDYEYRGDTEPVARCDAKFSSPTALRDCLAANRRVQVLVTGSSPR
jgi:OmpA-OmpF porin, OOP family